MPNRDSSPMSVDGQPQDIEVECPDNPMDSDKWETVTDCEQINHTEVGRSNKVGRSNNMFEFVFMHKKRIMIGY